MRQMGPEILLQPLPGDAPYCRMENRAGSSKCSMGWQLGKVLFNFTIKNRYVIRY